MNKKIAGLGPILFFLLPVGGFILALFNVKSKTSAFVYISFAMLFGYAISFSDPSADSYRYAQAFGRFDNTLDYSKLVQLYRNGELRDLYQLLLFYFSSIFSNNPKVMYAIAGGIYGYFSYLSLKVFVKEKGERLDNYIVILGLVFFTYISLANINAFRFNTGAMVLFYSTYQFIVQRKNIWVIGILITPLIHYGFMLIVPVLLLYKLTSPFFLKNEKVKPLLLYIFIITFILSWILGTNSINLGFLSNTGVVSGAVGTRLEYINSENVTSIVESRNSASTFLGVQKYFNYAINIYVFISMLFLYKLLKNIKGDKTEYNRLFAFVLFFLSFAFIAISFPSGGRFMNIALIFFILYLGKFYRIYQRKEIKKLILWALPVFAFHITFINGMLPFLILSPTFWYGNVFWILLEGLGFSA